MDDTIARLWHDLFARIQGPMHLRLLTQPVIAIIFGIRAGLHIKKTAQSPKRHELFQQSLADVGRMFIVGLVLDVVYQLWVLRFVYPGEAILVSILLVVLPYVLVRGVTFRLTRKSRGSQSNTKPEG